MIRTIYDKYYIHILGNSGVMEEQIELPGLSQVVVGHFPIALNFKYVLYSESSR